jgi:hypothetical protein
MKLIELTTVDFHTRDLNLIVINMDKIIYFMPCEDSEDTVIGLGLEGEFRVKQSVSEIREKIEFTE